MFDEQVVDMATGFKPGTGTDLVSDIMGMMVHHVKDIPPWWSRNRDAEMRSFWKDGQSASIVMGLAQNKLSVIPIRVVPRDMSITAHIQQAKAVNERLAINSEFGLGLHQAMTKFAEDFLGQDNGAFLEVLGGGDPGGPIAGPVYGVRHLDSGRCTRTGDPIYPIVYSAKDGKRYKFHNARVIFISQMPSPIRRMNTVGFCSVSRSLRLVQNMHHVINYQDEKMGARAASQILVGSGITGKEIIKTIAASEHMMDNLGVQNLARTVALGSPTGEIDLKRIELNNFDPFDEATTKTFTSYALAAAWGLEFQDLIPVSGTKASESISLQRARVRLPQVFMNFFLQQANTKLVPAHLKVEMDFVDDQADQQQAVIQDIFSRSYERLRAAGVVTPEAIQQILFEKGYITRNQLKAMQLSRGKLENGMPVQSLFFNKSYSNYLFIPPELLIIDRNNTEAALNAINVNEVHIYSMIGATGSSVVHSAAEESLRALTWLRRQYEEEGIVDIEIGNDDIGADNEDVDSPRDGRLTNQEAGETKSFFTRNKLKVRMQKITLKNLRSTLRNLFSPKAQTKRKQEIEF